MECVWRINNFAKAIASDGWIVCDRLIVCSLKRQNSEETFCEKRARTKAKTQVEFIFVGVDLKWIKRVLNGFLTSITSAEWRETCDRSINSVNTRLNNNRKRDMKEHFFIRISYCIFYWGFILNKFIQVILINKHAQIQQRINTQFVQEY